MIKLGHTKEINMIEKLPQEVKRSVKDTLTILDDEYGKNRNIDNEGGYIILVENKKEFEILKQLIFIDIEVDAIPEYVDIIKCENGEVFTNSLILSNSDFSITIIMSMEITPENFKKYIIHE